MSRDGTRTRRNGEGQQVRKLHEYNMVVAWGHIMHGLIFVTWEKYLAERFGTSTLSDYRRRINESPSDAPLTSRVYDDALLIAGVAAAHDLTRVPVDTLLYEYGRYFIINGLTSRLCSYLLDQVSGARDLLLTMSRAHAQMAHASEGIAPPLFGYDAMPGDDNGLYLYYDSPRKLCDLLRGSIAGAAERYSERVQVVEESCMKRGGTVCAFAIRFAPISGSSIPSQPLAGASRPWASGGSQPGAVPDPQAEAQRRLADMIYVLLPETGGLTLSETQEALQARHPELAESSRPFIVLEALNHLHHAGWVATSANEPGDALGNRRYWRAKRIDA